MKRFFRLASLLLVLAFSASCNPDLDIVDVQTDGEIETGTTEQVAVLFSSDAGYIDLSLESNFWWKLKAVNDRADEWLTFSPTSGKWGEAVVKISVAANTDYEERSASLEFRCGWHKKIIRVTQKQKDAVLLTPGTVEMDAKGGTFEVGVDHNVAFDIIMDKDTQSWIRHMSTKALDHHDLTFSVAENDGLEKREGTIRFAYPGGAETVKVYQAGGSPALVLGSNEYTISAAGGEVRIDVTSNVNVTYEVKSSWVSEVRTKAMSTNTYYFKVEPNSSYDDRSCVITFKSEEYNLSESVVIYQRQQSVIATTTEYDFDYKAQSLDVKVDSNVDFSVAIEEGVDWIHHVSTKGLTTHTLSFTLDENKTKETRTAHVTLSSDDLAQTLTFTQIPTVDSYPITEEAIKESEKRAQEFFEDASGILDNLGTLGNGKKDAAQAMAELLKLDDVVTATVDDDGNTVTVMHRDSTITHVLVNIEGLDMEDKPMGPLFSNQPDPVTQSNDKPAPKTLYTRKALLLAPFLSDFKTKDGQKGCMYVNANWIKSKIDQFGYKLDYYPDEEADLKKFVGDSLAKYDLIMVITHGGHWMKTATPAPYNPYYTIYTTGQKVDNSFLEEFEPELYRHVNKVMTSGSIGTYCVNQDWFEATTTDRYPGSIIYIGACHSFEERDMYNYFSSRGVASFMGWGDEFYYQFDQNGINQASYILYSMIRSLCKGMSFKKAYEYVNTDPALWTTAFSNFAKKHPITLNAESEEDVFLVDPRPFMLESDVTTGTATLTWENPVTEGYYEYQVHVNDFVFDVQQAEKLVLTYDQLPAGKYTWYVTANLYEKEKGKFIDSYNSFETGNFEMKEPQITVITQDARDITPLSATITGAFRVSDWKPDITERGIVYSRSVKEPSALEINPMVDKAVAGKDNPFTVKLSNLLSSTKYYARAYVIVNMGDYVTAFYGNTITFKTDTDEMPPEIAVSTNELEFGDVAIGETARLDLTISNNGESVLIIDNILCSDDFSSSFYEWSEDDKYIGVTPRTLRVWFTPTKEKDYVGYVHIVSNDPSNPDVYIRVKGTGVKPIDTVVPEEIREKMEPYIPIYDGVNPPNVEGTYLASPFVAVYCEDGHYSPGHQVVDLVLRFSNQDFTLNRIDLDTYEKGISSSSGPGAFISGDGADFSAFFNIQGTSYGVTFKEALVISGTMTNQGIKNLYYAFVMVEKGDDPNHKVMEAGYFRVFKDKDGLSVPTSWNPSSAPTLSGSPIQPGSLELVAEGHLDGLKKNK